MGTDGSDRAVAPFPATTLKACPARPGVILWVGSPVLWVRVTDSVVGASWFCGLEVSILLVGSLVP